MSDTTARRLALRNRMLATVVCTTGSISISATTTGYARASGSFVTDGFAVGMQVVAAGFGTAANNGASVITSVSALSMLVTKYALSTVSASDNTATMVAGAANVTEAAGSGRSIACGIPLLRSFDTKIAPTPGCPYWVEEMVPGPSGVRTFPVQRGRVVESGLYINKYYGLSGIGSTAIQRVTDAVIARLASGTTLSVSVGTLHVDSDPGPRAGQALPQGDGWTVCLVTIPYVATSQNAVAA